ncbi:neuropilin and tolloid-like isoform X1 [Temnothorax americanus]|uniref:neuropilin and tolloid-like isoform X1 n=1 Tax=Temnothorax americanus TaxID=1964332 RepID=UPI0040689CF1
MLLRRALAIATGKSRGHGRIARFKFIDVRANGPTMVARLPQQVLLLLVLVTGASTGEAEDPRWSTYSARKTSRSSLPRSWPSSSLEHAARETRPSNGKLPETSSWSVDRSSPGTRSDPSFLGTVVERSEEDEDGRRMQSPRGNDIENAKITSHNPSISSRSNETSQTDPSNRISIESSSSQSSTIGYHLVRTSSTSRSSYDIVPTLETRLSFETLSRENVKNTTLMTTSTKDIAMPRRHMRHIPSECEKFEVGDPAKREFYSPNYPADYPNNVNCVRVLEADKGMLLKLDFRDEFKLEDSPDCGFDYLEVRDGQYGYSNLLGKFCGTNFPPEITSKTRYLWLQFHSDENIEGKGFKAVWNTIPRPTYPGVLPEPEPCIFNVTGTQVIIHSNNVEDRKAQAEKEGFPLDCMWIIQVKVGWKIQLVLDPFSLQLPNECEANFVEIFEDQTDIPSRKNQFCGSIADTVVVSTNIAHLRFYAEPKAINSSFEAVMTAVREKNTASGEKVCKEDEYDCEDTTCIAAELECNDKINCRFKWDEDETKCNKKNLRLIDSQHIVIILVVFSLIMFGMSFAFVFNCVRKLIRDHRIIQEHIRQSRENRLDEMGRKSTPCPISVSTTDLHDHGSESPSLEVLPSKELMPPTTMILQEYTKDLVLEMTYNTGDITDIHQSNNVSNATQERLQESSEEPEMRDNCCQTRESLFEPRISDAGVPLGFTTFGVRAPSSHNGTNLHHHHHHHLHRQQSQQSPQQSHQSAQSSQPSSQSSQQSSQQQSISQCSGCSPASRGRDGSMGICPKHNPIPAPPGWSTTESSYPLPMPHTAQYPEQLDYPSYQRFQSPKPSRNPSGVYRQSPKFIRQAILGSGERYGSSMYGSGHGSSNTTSSTSQHSSGNTPTKRQPQPILDPRYRAEAVIEVDQRRPFSIESTKSAPDVIATH